MFKEAINDPATSATDAHRTYADPSSQQAKLWPVTSTCFCTDLATIPATEGINASILFTYVLFKLLRRRRAHWGRVTSLSSVVSGPCSGVASRFYDKNKLGRELIRSVSSITSITCSTRHRRAIRAEWVIRRSRSSDGASAPSNDHAQDGSEF
ncbi:hypothetical protein EI94DRAFT_1271894 [Lactarius quietus]|nr:hypothetical protein EI94DRAFT_1271894 [Lactarius quietus]